MSRQGKHRPGKVSIGIYVEEEKRALLAYIVDLSGMTATDIIMEGVLAKARSLGVIKDGHVLPRHKKAIEVIMEAYRQPKRTGAKK